jgi:hypothetical protein
MSNTRNVVNAQICGLTDAQLNAVTGGSINADQRIAEIGKEARDFYCRWFETDPMACQR